MVTHNNVKRKNRQETINRGKINGLEMQTWHKSGLALLKAFDFA
jgi:hypothetical protein